MSCLWISATVFSFVSLALLLPALNSNSWVTDGFHMGLWKFCTLDFQCFPLQIDVANYLQVTRAYMLMATVLGAISVFSLFFSSCCPRVGSVSLVNVAAIASIIAGVCAMLAIATFTEGQYRKYVEKVELSFNWPPFLVLVSVPLFLLTGALACKAHNKMPRSSSYII